ncbi:YecA family protein [Bradyrhizobium betae]|uniref:YecA family protein n=1 Tax=Bradyrhizobium betae TaxID=244734 RepID=UPI0013E96F0F|nr:SEC-C metal-binding domain-containing protein [Bradyrhizobium betae]
MAKIGRNQPCDCGSGLKYKKCHGKYPISASFHDAEHERAFQQAIRKMEAERVQRQKQQGLGKGIISAPLNDHRIVAVGNRVYYSKNWRTFHDFLRGFLIDLLGKDWFQAESNKPDPERHPIVRWFHQAITDAKRLSVVSGDIHVGPMTGAQRAFINLAYNLYLIAHHADPKQVDQLTSSFVERLKSERADDFIGKLFETYAAAAFLKAGFNLAYENETDGRSSHVEFVATYPKTGAKFSVEVKARNRSTAEDGPIDEIKRLRVGNKLNKALSKHAQHTRIVVIEVNVPDIVTEPSFEDGWPRAALDQIRSVEKAPAPDGGEKPSAYVLVTNHSFHNNLDAIGSSTQVIAAGCRIPDFGPDVGFNRLKEVLESHDRHKEMLALLDSMREHYEIPSTFDGENPDFAFAPKDSPPRLRFGEIYSVPDARGKEIPARLYEAIVLEREKAIMGCYQSLDGGENIMVRTPMTDLEIAAWKRHPDTFFGELRQIPKRATNWIELAMSFYDTYKSTPREKLLEWMAMADDIEYLKTLSQADLAILYCERLGWGAANKP